MLELRRRRERIEITHIGILNRGEVGVSMSLLCCIRSRRGSRGMSNPSPEIK